MLLFNILLSILIALPIPTTHAMPVDTPNTRAMLVDTPHTRAMPVGTPHTRAIPVDTPHTRAKRAIFDIIPDRSHPPTGVPGSVCECEQAGSICVISVNMECEEESSLQAHRQRRNNRRKIRKLFKKWLQKKRIWKEIKTAYRTVKYELESQTRA